jgi:RNA polymerase sigma-70 factor (ECF subfamily)
MSELTISTLSDTALVERIRTGDARAFEALHDRYRGELLRHAERVLGGRRSAAEDVVQESMWRAHRAIVAGTREVALQPWLHRIVHNRALDELRKREVVSLEDRMDRVGTTDDLQSIAERREGLNEVLADVIALPPRQREAIVGHVFGGQGHAEMAGRMGLTVGASKSLLNRARTSLVRAQEERLAA